MSKILSRRKILDRGLKALIALSSLSLVSLYRNRSESALTDAIANLEAQIPRLMRSAVVPGLDLAIIRDGKLFWNRGFGVKNLYTKEPVTNGTIFAAASLCKPLFAYAVLKLVERGQLNLDDPLAKYTAKPYISDSRIEQINIRKVLSHTTGFPNWSGDNPLKIEFPPGSRFGYSGEGYLYLQKVVEEVTQKPLEEYFRQEILIPLDMDSSSLIWQPVYESTASFGHNRQGKPVAMGKPKRASAAGSLRTTAADYAKFLIAMMNPGEKNSPTLTEPSLNQMLRSQVKINQSLDWGFLL